MDEQNGKNPLVAISAILALFTALGVVAYVQAPLKGIRPPMPQIQERSPKIGARLWQDPFQAVLDQTKTKDWAGPATKPAAVCIFNEAILTDTAPLLKEIEAHSADQKKITVLGVMVFGAPYEEEMENRLRKRYAVLSGLNRLRFVPKDAEHLGYVRIFQSQQECREAINQPSLTTIMPFEWFVSEDEKEAVLLLWINDDVFQDQPLAKLSILVNQIQSQTRKPQLEFKLIGPAGSTTLLEMLKEIQTGLKTPKSATAGASPGNDNFCSPLRGLKIYSATATAEKSILDQELKKTTGGGLDPGEDSIAAKFLKRGITFYRTINTDEELAAELVAELELREVGPPDHIALISEWDTFYGRSLPKSFQKAWKARYVGVDAETRIQHFSYLRAIDGQLPGERESAGKGEQKNGGDRKDGKDIKKLEEPTGKSQYDYLRRLAERIYLKDQQLKNQGNGKIRAIGVLGSDFYDKYLVLQALGQRFPEIIFFTTDLDARLLHPASIEWTRNLVVASGFGLQLREGLPDQVRKMRNGSQGDGPDFRRGLQGDLPPFRDVYQTSVYLATLKAFDDPPHRLLEKTDIPRPRIFEIGRQSAIDLTTGRGEPTTIHPPRDLSGLSGNDLIGVMVIIFLVLLLLWFMSFRVQKGVKRLGQFFSRNPEMALLALFAFILIFYLGDKFDKVILQNPREEPFSLFEGVSVWPTAGLRLVAIGLSLFFSVASIFSLRKSERNLTQKFFALGREGKPATAAPSYRRNLQSWWPTRVSQCREFRNWFGKKERRISIDEIKVIEIFPRGVEKFKEHCQEIRRDWGVDRDQDQVRVKEVWREYVRRGSFWLRLKRIIPLLIIYFAVCGLIIGFFGAPVTPVRGGMSRLINKYILLAAIFSFLFLTFLVFDATSLCRRFVGMFLGKEPQWEPALREYWREKVGLADAALGDWMLIQLIAQHTETVGRLIFYPLIVWFILFICRLRYFDNWRTPIGLFIVISMGAVLAWSCAFMLRRTAEKLRTDILERLAFKMRAAKPPDQEPRQSLQHLLEEVKTIKTGAFALSYHNPLVQSLLVPIGGISGVSLLDLLSKLT